MLCNYLSPYCSKIERFFCKSLGLEALPAGQGDPVRCEITKLADFQTRLMSPTVCPRSNPIN